MEMVPNSNFAHQARSSHVNMLCIIDKYSLCEIHLNALAGQKGEICDLVTPGHLCKIALYITFLVRIIIVLMAMAFSRSPNSNVELDNF